ncbi:AraC family ligand binding domain-containing protein [Paenibacillus vandeheii]
MRTFIPNCFFISGNNDFKGYYHWHQCGEILHVHEGHGIVVLNNHTYPIHKGMLCFFQPYQLHHAMPRFIQIPPMKGKFSM